MKDKLKLIHNKRFTLVLRLDFITKTGLIQSFGHRNTIKVKEKIKDGNMKSRKIFKK